MEYKIKKEQLEQINIFRNKSRLDANDISKLKSLYDELINQYKKVIVDWRCPVCLRNVIKELIRFSEKSEIIDESKVVKRKRSTKTRKSSK